MMTVEVTCNGRTEVGEITANILFAKKEVKAFVEKAKSSLNMQKGDPYHVTLMHNGAVVAEKDAIAGE